MACILFVSLQSARAETDYEAGVQAYQSQQFDQARTYWEQSTADGNISATFNLGLLLSKGIGGPADEARAAELFRITAESGLAIGQHNLALSYYSGKGVDKDHGQARIWWERAARQGHTQAQFNLGALLWNGDGVEKDAGEAVKWFREASDAGHLQARSFLDSIFEEASLRSPGQAPDNPDSVADPKVDTLLEQAAAAYRQQNFETAHQHWKQAADQGNAIAQYQLGRLYRDGRGVEKDPALAYEYIDKSARQNLAQAQYGLAMYYLEGLQVDKNETLALFWMQSAADQGHLQARDYLERSR